MTVLDGLPADYEAAVRIWHAANVARLLPPALTGWPGSGRSWPSLRPVLSSATSTRAGTYWRWHWLNPGAGTTALARSSPTTATCPWSMSTPTCGDEVPAASCCRDFTSVHPKEAGAARRYGPRRRTHALDASTKARDTEGQAMRRPLAAVIPCSSSVKHPDRNVRWRIRYWDRAVGRARSRLSCQAWRRCGKAARAVATSAASPPPVLRRRGLSTTVRHLPGLVSRNRLVRLVRTARADSLRTVEVLWLSVRTSRPWPTVQVVSRVALSSR